VLAAMSSIASPLPARSSTAPLVLLVVGGAAAVAVPGSFAPSAQAWPVTWSALAFVLAGLTARWHRPGHCLGLLMIAAGCATLLSDLATADAAILHTLGCTSELLAAAMIVQLLVTFPTGRLDGPPERAIVAAAYAAAVTLQPAVTALVALAGIGLVAARRRDSGRPLRRSLALAVHALAFAVLMLAAVHGATALGVPDGPALDAIRRAAQIAIGLAPLAFLAFLLEGRLARSAISDVFVALPHDPTPAELCAALARAVRDRSLSLAYWLPEFQTWADADGRPIQLPDGTGPRAATIVERGGLTIAALIHDAALRDEPEVLDAATAAAAIALENVGLNVELRARLDELKGSRARIVEAGDAERRRLERNLHDGAQQRLVGVALHLRMLQARIRDDPATAEQLAAMLSDELAESLDELRELARGLHPAVLEHGLQPALDALAARSRVPTTITYEAGGRLPEPIELAAYFVACEALTNVAKYSGAGAATIAVRREGATVRITIADDGTGGADDTRGSGLRGLADRVEALDGRLRVDSPAGAGTVVTAELPCAPSPVEHAHAITLGPLEPRPRFDPAVELQRGREVAFGLRPL
jgi:signal transduction histidine kinase